MNRLFIEIAITVIKVIVVIIEVALLTM